MSVLVERVVTDPSSVHQWFKAGLRVGKLTKEAKEYRQWLNYAGNDDLPSHPSPGKATSFKLLPQHLIPKDMPMKRKLIVVETVSDLMFCEEQLLLTDQIAFDSERDQNFNYRTLTSAIQLSTNEYDFFVDTVKLYDMIEIHLGHIFANESIVKLVFDYSDLREIQKDFKIFCNAVVDVQHVVKTILQLDSNPCLESVVKRYVDDKVDLNKSYQRFPWRLRKLPEEAIRYAISDSYYLFLVWEMLKCQKNDFLLNEYDLKWINDKVIQKYKNPVLKPISLFCRCTRNEHIEFRYNLKWDDHFKLFQELLSYAEEKAKEFDCNRNSILKIKQMAILTYKKPKSLEELHNVIPYSVNWPKLRQFQVTALIEVFDTPKLLEPIDKVDENWDDDDLQVVFDNNEQRNVSVIRNDTEGIQNEMEIDCDEILELLDCGVEKDTISDVKDGNCNVELNVKGIDNDNEVKMDELDTDELLIDCNMDLEIVDDEKCNVEAENCALDAFEINENIIVIDNENCNIEKEVVNENVQENVIVTENTLIVENVNDNANVIDKVTKYDNMDDNLIDRISCTELVENWYEIRTSKLSNRQKNYLRTKRTFIMKGVKRLRRSG